MDSARVTIAFRSDSGRQYLYDDVTSLILPWDDLRERALCEQIDGVGCGPPLAGANGELEQPRAYVRMLRDGYGAFVRSVDEAEPPSIPSVEELEQRTRLTTHQLVLVLTEDCNLRCRYCGASSSGPSAYRLALRVSRS